MTTGSIEIVGLQAVQLALLSLGDRVGDINAIAPGLAEEWYANVERTIRSGNDGSYEDLTEAYAVRKQKDFGSKPILVAGGEMATALTSSSSPDSVYIADQPGELTLGVTGRSGKLASIHQRGADPMPVREVYVITDLFTERVKDRIRDDLSAYARQLGFGVQ